MANTTTNWEVRIADDQTGARAVSDNGRVAVEMEKFTEGGDVVYPISVYESYHYQYRPRYNDGEFIDHSLVAHVRPTDHGSGWAESWGVAVELFVNTLTSIERDQKWVSEPVTAPVREFVDFNIEVAAREFNNLLAQYVNDELGMIHQERLPDSDGRDVIRELAVENKFNKLATVVGVGNELDVEELYIETFE